MLKSNFYILVFLLSCLMMACKPLAQNFSYKQHINVDFFHDVLGVLGDAHAHIDSVKMYRAVLSEKLIERNEVTEYKLMNELSSLPTVDLQVLKNYNHLYLMQLFTTPAQDDIMIFLSIGYRPDGRCTNIGPAYLGNLRINQIDVKRELKVKKTKNIYWLTQSHKKEMNIFFKEDFPEVEDVNSVVDIQQIILQEANKVGGDKPVIFHTERIFNDSNALSFQYVETLRR